MPKSAEQRVLSRLGEALPPPYELFANVRWISKPERNSPARDGETDLVIMHPRHGLLIVETKGGRIRRDGQGRWWTNEQPLKVPPFKQAENTRHALRRKIASLPEIIAAAPGTRDARGAAEGAASAADRGGPGALADRGC
jgi:hypothetical protein